MYSIHVKIHGVLKPENLSLMEDLKHQIYTGKFQRDMLKDEVVTKCTANINQINDRSFLTIFKIWVNEDPGKEIDGILPSHDDIEKQFDTFHIRIKLFDNDKRMATYQEWYEDGQWLLDDGSVSKE